MRTAFFKLWIKKSNVIKSGDKIISSYVWYYFVSAFLFSQNVFSAFNVIRKRIFLPMGEFALYRQEKSAVNSCSQYIKRLMLPFRLSRKYRKLRKIC